MGSTTFKWNEKELSRVTGKSPETVEAVTKATRLVERTANAISSGFRTGIWHEPKTHETRGNTRPKYEGDVDEGRVAAHGIVYTGNYSAMKDNAQNNTLLKSIG